MSNARSARRALAGLAASLIGFAAALPAVAAGDAALHEALEQALATPDVLERTAKVGTLLADQPPEALPGLLEVFKSADNRLDGIDKVLFAEWWARFDPASAVTQLIRPWGGDHPEAIATAARVWARRDPEMAGPTAIRASQLSPNLVAYVTDFSIRGWDEGQKPGVADFVAAQPPITQQQQAAAFLARRWVLRDGADLAIYKTVHLDGGDRPDPNGFKSNMYRGISSSLARVDPERARIWAEEVGEDDYGHSVYRRVASQLAKGDGRATLEWLRARPAGRRRDIGIDSAFRNWYREDRPAALEYASEIPVEDWSGPIISAYTAVLVGDEPEKAIGLASQIVDERRRSDTLVRLARAWRGREPEAAAEWIDASPLLDDELRRRIALPLPSERRRGKPQPAGSSTNSST